VRGRHCRICLRCLVCPLICVTLIVIVPAPVLTATPVLPILMALLRACAKMLRTRATISTSHWSALLALVKDRLVVLHTGAHSIHGLSLLRPLMRHHWRRRTTRARVPINRHWLRS
jgi:ABC-type glutathione transport system ATPase component